MSNAQDLMSRELLPPAVRASLLRLMADEAGNLGPRVSLADMGTAADRAGHEGVAIGFQAPACVPAPVALQVLIFDPATGALLAQEFAYCKRPAGAYPASGNCRPSSYSQILEIKAVPAIPEWPPATSFPASP
jgi:hypothetical protein